MAKGLKIEASGFDIFNNASQVVFDAVKDAMDDIRDDVVAVSESLAPHKTGKLEKAHRTRRYYKNLQQCYFTVTYTATNKGFDYATWIHDEDYKLGAGSRAKQPKKSRFGGSFRVGKNYLTQVEDECRSSWSNYIAHTINRKLAYEMRSKRKK